MQRRVKRRLSNNYMNKSHGHLAGRMDMHTMHSSLYSRTSNSHRPPPTTAVTESQRCKSSVGYSGHATKRRHHTSPACDDRTPFDAPTDQIACRHRIDVLYAGRDRCDKTCAFQWGVAGIRNCAHQGKACRSTIIRPQHERD